jgi:uncharacterized membrane protein
MSAYGISLLLVLGALIVVAIFLFLPLRRSNSANSSTARSPSPAAIYRDDDRYWFAGAIYYNPDDPDLIVPKRFGWGWTVNFARPEGKIVLIVIILLCLVPVILMLLGVQLTPIGCHPAGCAPAP